MNRPTTIHSLAESTTFADENLAHRRSAAFGAAQRHSRRVMFLRRVLPAVATGAVLLTIAWMWLTVILGVTFLGLQGFEYVHAYHELNLKLSSGIYGSTFFMLTGFHGFHVFVGMMMLLFITIRIMKGHFTPQRHFGFEGAAWYWHFVDVVWLGLYVVVYWL